MIASTAAGTTMPGTRKVGQKNLFSFISLLIFVASVLFAIGVFGYKFYLKYRIEQMGADLTQALTTIQPEPTIIRELIRFNYRIDSTQELISQHKIVSALFEFLEISTPRTVRFVDFRYEEGDEGLELSLRGEARGYAALALQADIFSKSEYLKNPIFSDLNLNDRGDVNFTFHAVVDPSLVSYDRVLQLLAPTPTPIPTSEPVSPTTDSTSPINSGQPSSP